MSFTKAVYAPTAMVGAVGGAYGLVQHYGRDRYDVDPINTTMWGAGAGLAVGLTTGIHGLRTGRYSMPSASSANQFLKKSGWNVV